MSPAYAQKILEGGSAFGSSFLSCHDGLLVVRTKSDEWFLPDEYHATQLNEDGSLKVEGEYNHVVFRQVKPIINKDTRFELA